MWEGAMRTSSNQPRSRAKVPGVTKTTLRKLIWKDLWEADMGYVLREYFFNDDPDGTKYGYLPKIAMASKGMMCAVMGASFCERANSCAGMVVDETNSLLSVDEIDKVTVFCMNKEFMKFMRREYPEVMTLNSSHGKYGTVVTMRRRTSRIVRESRISPTMLIWLECPSPLHLLFPE